jgi:SAM-dependent methyltransferase
MINFNEISSAIDSSLGLDVEGIEATLLARAKDIMPQGNHHLWGEALHEGNQTWVGLHPETLQTPYEELKEACGLLELKPNDLVVDLGAGYGRLGFILAALYPGVHFLGVEYVKERVEEGKRIFNQLSETKLKLVQGDLSDQSFVLPLAQHYFIYDFGKISHIRSILDKFSKHSDHQRYNLIARGQGIRSLIDVEYPWLIEAYRRKNFSVYRG